MSLEELFKDDNFLPMMSLYAVIFILIGVPIILLILKQIGKRNDEIVYGIDTYDEYCEEKYVIILAKRTAPHPYAPNISVNYILFEFENGSRIELAIKDPLDFGVVTEGDIGTLCYNDNHFINFERC